MLMTKLSNSLGVYFIRLSISNGYLVSRCIPDGSKSLSSSLRHKGSALSSWKRTKCFQLVSIFDILVEASTMIWQTINCDSLVRRLLVWRLSAFCFVISLRPAIGSDKIWHMRVWSCPHSPQKTGNQRNHHIMIIVQLKYHKRDYVW